MGYRGGWYSGGAAQHQGHPAMVGRQDLAGQVMSTSSGQACDEWVIPLTSMDEVDLRDMSSPYVVDLSLEHHWRNCLHCCPPKQGPLTQCWRSRRLMS